MRIPEIQTRLTQLADEHGIPELLDLAAELRRRSPSKRAPALSTPMCDEMRSKIRQMAARHPDLPYSRIAAALNINPGRVSEVMHGVRR